VRCSLSAFSLRSFHRPPRTASESSCALMVCGWWRPTKVGCSWGSQEEEIRCGPTIKKSKHKRILMRGGWAYERLSQCEGRGHYQLELPSTTTCSPSGDAATRVRRESLIAEVAFLSDWEMESRMVPNLFESWPNDLTGRGTLPFPLYMILLSREKLNQKYKKRRGTAR